jgi:hypothetical protein
MINLVIWLILSSTRGGVQQHGVGSETKRGVGVLLRDAEQPEGRRQLWRPSISPLAKQDAQSNNVQGWD